MRRAACTAPAPAPAPAAAPAPTADAKGGGRSGDDAAAVLGVAVEGGDRDRLLQLRGSKPPRRPKKRPRNVQRVLDLLVPGSSLTEITKNYTDDRGVSWCDLTRWFFVVKSIYF
uniref:Uncharacterized protein n=1 Tax=Ananas comosus var. bracteatus TaxID=296719 RepID=A0A6V7Q5G8_ANACO|nr:unnamed protein product [Ananas comosus var. bracteatus]